MPREWVFDGGRGCVDLVNTVRDRHAEPRELLPDPDALAGWLVACGLLPRRVRPTGRQLRAAHALRETIDRVLRALSDGVPPEHADVRALNAAARSAPPPVPQLHVDEAGHPSVRPRTPPDRVAGALAALAAEAIELAATAPTVRICAAGDCGLRFLDTSPKGNRQWCSMARCGNRAKARAHYSRTRRERG